MSTNLTYRDLDPSCPLGGQWYACTTGSLFVGCCQGTNDPCGQTGCSAGNLKPASFEPNNFGQYPDQNCPVAALWWSCAVTNPPFMGCCKTNPCQNSGCPQADLVAGILNTENDVGYVTNAASTLSTTSSQPSSSTTFVTSGLSSASTSPSTSVTASATAVASTQATTSATPTPAHKLSTGAIAGIAVGSFAGAVVLMGMVMWWCRRHSRKSRDRHSLTRPTMQPIMAEPQEFMQYGKSPGTETSLGAPSPMSPMSNFGSRPTTIGSPAQFGSQYGQAGAQPYVSPNSSMAVGPRGAAGLGFMDTRATGSGYNTPHNVAGAFHGASPVHSNAATFELPG